MEKGARIRVQDYKGRALSRRVWSAAGSRILACTEEAFRRALKTGEEPACVEFAPGDVLANGSVLHPGPRGPKLAKPAVGSPETKVG